MRRDDYDKVPMLYGQKITGVERTVNEDGNDMLVIRLETHAIQMTHCQDGRESVYLEDDGDIGSLVGGTLLDFEVAHSSPEEDKELYYISLTWTFFKVRTSTGYATLRWFGSGNGYYAEDAEVFVRELKQEEPNVRP